MRNCVQKINNFGQILWRSCSCWCCPSLHKLVKFFTGPIQSASTHWALTYSLLHRDPGTDQQLISRIHFFFSLSHFPVSLTAKAMWLVLSSKWKMKKSASLQAVLWSSSVPSFISFLLPVGWIRNNMVAMEAVCWVWENLLQPKSLNTPPNWAPVHNC